MRRGPASGQVRSEITWVNLRTSRLSSSGPDWCFIQRNGRDPVAALIVELLSRLSNLIHIANVHNNIYNYLILNIRIQVRFISNTKYKLKYRMQMNLLGKFFNFFNNV